MPPEPPAIDLRCEADCFQPCANGQDIATPELLAKYPKDAGAAAAMVRFVKAVLQRASEVLADDASLLAACDDSRAMCVECIQRGRDAGAIR